MFKWTIQDTHILTVTLAIGAFLMLSWTIPA